MLNRKTYNLFLDDFRNPSDAFNYTRDKEFNLLEWEIVRTHDEFVDYINMHGEPAIVSFDHDLADVHYEHQTGEFPYNTTLEKTGYHSAKFLIDYCIDNKLKFPKYKVHSMNNVGRENITKLVENFIKFQNSN